MANATPSVEIIEFFRPDENEKNLYVSNIPAKFEESELREALESCFSAYGLLYEVQLKEAGDFTHTDGAPACKKYYAFVKFFSAVAAAKAKDGVAGRLFLKGQHLKVQFCRRRQPIAERQALYLTRCYELANYYLGFNGWSCHIVKMSDLSSGSCDAVCPSVQMLCVVKLTVCQHSLCTRGVGVSQSFTWEQAGGSTRSTAVCRARKQSYQMAVQEAFSRLLLVILDTGRVHVEVNTTYQEQFFAEEGADTEPCLKVTEVSYSSDCEDGEDDLEITDSVNKEILQQLASDSF